MAVWHPEFLEDLQHWIDTDRRTARRITQEHHCVYPVKDDRVDFLQGLYHY